MNIFISGPSGSGKSTSLRHLDPESTVLINTECKDLPFRDAAKFKRQARPESYQHFVSALDKALLADNVELVVIDSFTSFVELVYEDVTRHESRGYDGWANYKHEIRDQLIKAKRSDVTVVWLGVDTVVEDESLRSIKTIAVQGSLKGQIEKEFEICLWSTVIDGEYKFLTNSDGRCTAKSPMGMFESKLIDNDLSIVLDAIASYYPQIEVV